MDKSIHETIKSRESTHGSWEEGAAIAQQLKRTLYKQADSRPDYINEALDRICMKLSRIAIGDPMEADHWHDIAGYATLTEQAINKRPYANTNI
jgi:hypothetical protein